MVPEPHVLQLAGMRLGASFDTAVPTVFKEEDPEVGTSVYCDPLCVNANLSKIGTVLDGEC